MKKLIIALCLLCICLCCGCDLSHKHYYNDLGQCQCGEDIATELVYDSSALAYQSGAHEVVAGETYYYVLTARGESGCVFTLEQSEMQFDRIEIRADGMLQTTAMRTGEGNAYAYEQTLYAGRAFYFKITYKTSGEARIFVQGILTGDV